MGSRDQTAYCPSHDPRSPPVVPPGQRVPVDRSAVQGHSPIQLPSASARAAAMQESEEGKPPALPVGPPTPQEMHSWCHDDIPTSCFQGAVLGGSEAGAPATISRVLFGLSTSVYFPHGFPSVAEFLQSFQ